MKDTYDAGLLNDFGGGDVNWWQDYIRAELSRAHDFYQSAFGLPDAARVPEIAALIYAVSGEHGDCGDADPDCPICAAMLPLWPLWLHRRGEK